MRSGFRALDSAEAITGWPAGVFSRLSLCQCPMSLLATFRPGRSSGIY